MAMLRPVAPHIHIVCTSKCRDIRRVKISSAFALLFALDLKFISIFTEGANILNVTSHFLHSTCYKFLLLATTDFQSIIIDTLKRRDIIFLVFMSDVI